MKSYLIIAILLIGALAIYGMSQSGKTKTTGKPMDEVSPFYLLKATAIDGEEISMENYRGKVVLIVNTASKCGLTPHYEGLEKLHKQYSGKGLAVLGFPCNQFSNQEPGTNEDIAAFCSLNYGVSFQMFSKIDVNGENTHPVFKFLKSEKSGMMGDDIKWNFTKFLLDRNGNVVKRYAPTTKPESIMEDIEKLL
jgi:glutathione peroxidase